MYYDDMGGVRLKPKPCLMCGDEFQPKYGKQKYCGLLCSTVNTRQHKKPSKRLMSPQGFYIIRLPDGTKMPEHRHVYEKSRKVKLKTWHYVTWKDGDKTNNKPSNLTLSNAKLEEYVRVNKKLPAELGRTICPCGQPKDGVSTVNGHTRRYCRACSRASVREVYHRRKAREAKEAAEAAKPPKKTRRRKDPSGGV